MLNTFLFLACSLSLFSGTALAKKKNKQKPSTQPTVEAAEGEAEDPYPLQYQGFGGVSYNIINFPFFIQSGGSYINVPASGVYSFYLARIAKTRLYAGFGIGANFFNEALTDDNPANLFSPYDDIENVAGSFTSTESFFHVPIETNVSWVHRPIKRFQYWLGFGFSIHVVQYAYQENQNALAYSPDEDEYFFWEDRYGEGASSGARTEPGGQLFAGTEFIFGKIPRIGGEWGISLMAKTQFVRLFVVESNANTGYFYREEYLDGTANDTNNINEAGRQLEDYRVQNYSLGIGLNYHY